MKNLSERDKTTVAVNIRKLRENAGLTQRELAEKLYVSDNVISKWERGESLPDPENLARIAEVFGVEVSAIVYEDDDARTREQTERMRRRLPQNVFTALCMLAVTASAVVLFVLSIKAYLGLPDTIGIHFGADGEIDLQGSKAMLFMCPAVSVLFAVTSVVSNCVKMTWRVNMGVSVYIDDVFKDEDDREKIYKLLSVGLNVTLLAAQSLFVLLGCCMALQVAVPAAAMWIIVAVIVVAPCAFTVVGFVMAGKIKEKNNFV